MESDRRVVMRRALHLEAEKAYIALRGVSGKGTKIDTLFDDPEDADPVAAVRAAWKEWRALEQASPPPGPYHLAWLVGACRHVGIDVRPAASGGGMTVHLSDGLTQEAARPLVEALRLHRPAITDRLAAGKEFRCRDWQLHLVFLAAGKWPVWGMSATDPKTGKGGSFIYPLVRGAVPDYYPWVCAYRPDLVPQFKPLADLYRLSVWVSLGPTAVPFPGYEEARIQEHKARAAVGFPLKRGIYESDFGPPAGATT